MRRDLAVILALYLALAIGFSRATPFGAPPDEKPHAAYVDHLATKRTLPVLSRDQREAYEAHQPPLYYLLGAPIWWVTRGLPEATRAACLRLLSTVLGAVGLVLIYRLAQIVAPEDRTLAVGATAFAAFLPMRLATAAAVGNDLLSEAVFSATLLLLAGTIRCGISTPRTVALGLVLGAGLLSKSTCLLLFPVAALGMALSRPNPSRRFVAHVAGAFTLALLIGGWWLVRNQRLYGELFVAETFVRYFQDTARPELFLRMGYSFASYLFLLVIPLTFRSFWGVFGHMQIHMGTLTDTPPDKTPLLPPSWLYPLLVVPTAACLVGLARAYVRRATLDDRSRACWALLVVTWLLVAAAFLRFNTAFFQAQGRYLFPAMAPIALLFVLGLQSLAPAKARAGTAWGIASVMLALAVYALLGCVVPAFR